MAAGLAAFGVVLNRFNVSLTSYGGYRDFWYFPSVIEIILTVGLVAPPSSSLISACAICRCIRN